MRDVAALHGSRRLSHFSTTWNVDGLIFRVRDGYGSFPAAMAAAILIEAKVRIRTGVVMLCRHLRSRSATLAPSLGLPEGCLLGFKPLAVKAPPFG